MKTAVIIKGNPTYSKQASSFYHELHEFLLSIGYESTFDDGLDFTLPKEANLWIGFSRGIDRLKHAPKEILTLGIGGKWERSVNHPLDNCADCESTEPNSYHFLLTDEMKEELKRYLLS